MDTFNRLAWILLAAIHAPPAMATNQPPMPPTTTHTVDYSTAPTVCRRSSSIQ